VIDLILAVLAMGMFIALAVQLFMLNGKLAG
jgi:hypothetical protein